MTWTPDLPELVPERRFAAETKPRRIKEARPYRSRATGQRTPSKVRVDRRTRRRP